ncbi:MAG: hypothetical protein IKX33_06840 [Prevotella sp.]|nr:hypothetical protein [Prevotella sp.]
MSNSEETKHSSHSSSGEHHHHHHHHSSSSSSGKKHKKHMDDSDRFKRHGLSSIRRRKLISKWLFRFLCVVAIGVVLYAIWAWRN